MAVVNCQNAAPVLPGPGESGIEPAIKVFRGSHWREERSWISIDVKESDARRLKGQKIKMG